ncbi:hypothetical protein EVAR_33598_1 [Eumeta japonica]|uniref:Uncharacterized protein n=1 Tax=Eumeta variegata TaxID=151549 RepID=A0A4C1WBL9_EUMVA|nr:hypothetical protein EVAR_33598_1 [Eumeta japonica]
MLCRAYYGESSKELFNLISVHNFHHRSAHPVIPSAVFSTNFDVRGLRGKSVFLFKKPATSKSVSSRFADVHKRRFYSYLPMVRMQGRERNREINHDWNRHRIPNNCLRILLDFQARIQRMPLNLFAGRAEDAQVMGRVVMLEQPAAGALRATVTQNDLLKTFIALKQPISLMLTSCNFIWGDGVILMYH